MASYGKHRMAFASQASPKHRICIPGASAAYKCENISPFANLLLYYRPINIANNCDYKYVRWIQWILVASLCSVERNDVQFRRWRISLFFVISFSIPYYSFTHTHLLRFAIGTNGKNVAYFRIPVQWKMCINSWALQPFKFSVDTLQNTITAKEEDWKKIDMLKVHIICNNCQSQRNETKSIYNPCT